MIWLRVVVDQEEFTVDISQFRVKASKLALAAERETRKRGAFHCELETVNYEMSFRTMGPLGWVMVNFGRITSCWFIATCLLVLALAACTGPMVTPGDAPGGPAATNTGQSPNSSQPTSAPNSITPTPGPTGTTLSHQGLTSLNHIVFMIQENRSFDHYFGQLDQYRVQAQGLAKGAIDGLPPEGSPACANPGDPPNGCMPVNLKNASYTVTTAAFHLQTMCIENTSDSWYEAHQDFNLFNISSNTPTMDGFAWGAGGDANYANTVQPGSDKDTDGIRGLGFYDGNDLVYHYWLATQFATSDRWFAPGPMETEPNKMYLVAATSAGHVHKPTSSVNVPTIFSLLDAANVTWKVYYSAQPSDAILNFFQPYASQHSANIVPVSQYFSDLQNGTLPAVAMIEPPFNAGSDEHPGIGNNIQQGVALTKQYVDALMNSSSWKDSAFIITFDESGGLYDHVPPPTSGVPNPDGITPQDLIMQPPADPPGDFTRYGFRVPLMVVSPFTKKNYVSHTVTDSTAILRLIEERFNLPNLTKRDAVAMDMTEFFDFAGVPWATPPGSRPTQPTNGACYDGLP